MQFLTRYQTRPLVLPEHTPVASGGTTEPLKHRHHVPYALYLLPKDPLEDQRLNYQHHALYKTISNHYLAPIAPGSAHVILDVGTGTGIWPFEMSKLFPHAQIIGVDVSLNSLPSPLPLGCLFAQANVLHGLPFPDAQFSYTHQRLLVAGIPAVQWPDVVRELARVTRPGGWIELLEVGDTIQNAGPATKQLLTWLNTISQSFGFDMTVLNHLGDLLQQAGCQEVETLEIPIPLGAWAGALGQIMQTDVVYGYGALKDSFCPLANTPFEVFDAMVQATADEWEQRHCSYIFHAAYGRKRQGP